MSTQPSPDLWQRNLQALRLVDPDCAAQLADLAVPDNVKPATGRDGSVTWRICRDGGHEEWFGRSSMPTVSAESLLSNVNPGSGNVALPGIGTGREAQLLSERLGSHRAIVVLETEPLNLALALRLWDFSEGLTGRRLVLLTGSNVEALRDRLLEFGREHPGFEVPGCMVAWPWRGKDEKQAYQSLLEQVMNQLQVSRAQRLAEHLSLLSGTGTPDALAILTTVPGVVPSRLAGWLADAARAAGLDAVACDPQSPLSAGPMAGLEAAADLARKGRKPRIVLLEHCRAHWPLQDLAAPVITWLVGAQPTHESWQFPAGRDGRAVVSAESQRRQLLEQGWPADRVVVAPPLVSPKALETPLDGPRKGILLLADLSAEEAEEAGAKLYSHKVLWESLRERLDRQGDTWTPDEAQRWVLAAQKEAGMDFSDPVVLEEFTEAIRSHLAPAVILSRAARSVRDAGLPLRVAGHGWQRYDWAKDIWDGPADDPQRRLELLAGTKVAIVGQCRPGNIWVATEAAATGAAIVSRSLWPESNPLDLFQPNQQMLIWRTRQELVERLRHLLGNETARARLAGQARQVAQDRCCKGVLRHVLENREITGQTK